MDAFLHFSTLPSSPHGRTQSRSSPNNTVTASGNRQGSLDLNDFSSSDVAVETGIGNLADELADAFSDSGDEDGCFEDEVPAEHCNEDGLGEDVCRCREVSERACPICVADNGQYVAAEMPALGNLSPTRRCHRRRRSDSKGGEYCSEIEPDSLETMPGLISEMNAVEALAQQGTGNNGSPADGVLERLTDSLRDLGSQTGVEGSAARLITAHAALTTHLEHQTRQMQSLTFPILSPLVPPPHPDVLDDLLPLFVELSECMPRPATQAYDSLTALHSLTSDLIGNLRYLSDTLHMCRQTTTIAARRLKSAKDLVAELKRESDLRKEGELWLSRGNWSERLQKRECASVCGEVVGGFEELCNGWRTRLLDQAASAPA
ncbi:hypothetical protein SODALDRAFT_329462 [Sodiomyces alkalinus F11]|uniref:Uncharacterized protein n=1 Tax=Sodiomyces alkalinus (strain CBS 110278 / VKM F-3762 / F11) TaxID=1314773 RepID=A0A3N2PJV2_SODAK|nr:hypothetical protein SODALDRAFT_329462 [Sodiomyces alkalinus F11]ROT34812.1 hypothetical protein SODALDRAFT_329462 [Sodiomyces alkalinus F11]